MLQRLIGENIDLVWASGPDVWPIKIDPSQLDQILVNLCVNSRDAIAGLGKVTVETKNIILDTATCAGHLDFKPGEYVALVVSDDGCGMNEETQAKLFEPFFTTKETGKGTGLGLATVYGIVKQNNGFIDVRSRLGQGTTFTIYLPRHHDKSESVQQEEVGPARKGKETILLVEDEVKILKMTAIMLQRQGYTVLTADTPGEAIDLAEKHAGEIHLLMTDVIMPEMNGRDLARLLILLCPGLKQLFMSGYTADIIAHHGALEEGVNFIRKPFLIKELASKVREVLDQE